MAVGIQFVPMLGWRCTGFPRRLQEDPGEEGTANRRRTDTDSASRWVPSKHDQQRAVGAVPHRGDDNVTHAEREAHWHRIRLFCDRCGGGKGREPGDRVGDGEARADGDEGCAFFCLATEGITLGLGIFKIFIDILPLDFPPCDMHIQPCQGPTVSLCNCSLYPYHAFTMHRPPKKQVRDRKAERKEFRLCVAIVNNGKDISKWYGSPEWEKVITSDLLFFVCGCNLICID